MHYVPSYHSGRRSLPPLSAVDPHHALPSYPSSTLHYYYPSSHQVALYSHLPPAPHISHPFFSNPPHGGASGILPSVSQSHVPSIRRTPSSPSGKNLDNLNDIPASPSPHLAAHFHNPSRNSPRLDDRSQNISTVPPHLASVAHSHTLSSNSPLIDLSQHQPAPFLAAPQPVPAPFFAASQPLPPRSVPQNFHPLPPFAPPITSNLPTPFISSLPSTKDVPLLTGKHDWGPWHSAVRTLIVNPNLLGHIADDPHPGAAYDPGLWPTYPPVVHRDSTLEQLQSFTDWWSRDGLASHILTSRLSPSVLGCLPIANERMGQRRSSRTVYLTLHYQYGAGDYSAVMVIEARLRNLKCLPTRGGVRLTDFITTWRTSLNQMDAAGYPPSPRQILTIFADGLPQHSVAFVNLYDYIILSLNEPNEQMLPNIHQLFDRAVNLDNNLQRTRLLNPRRLPLSAPAAPSSSTTALVPPAPANSLPPATGTRSGRRCSNCGREGHTDDTCFQPSGAMEGRCEEYLASRPPRVAHIAEVEKNQLDNDEGTTVIEDATLTTEFAALSLTTSNEISFSTYAYSCISEILHDQPIALHQEIGGNQI